MQGDDLLKQIEEKMQKSVDVLVNEIKKIRVDKASPALVEGIKVVYYGTPTPLKQIAVISTPDEKTLIIKPYDPSILGDVEKAILKSEIGLTPQNDGKVIKLVMPPLSQERREQLKKSFKSYGENTKIAIRNIRREAIKQIEEQEKQKKISEDEKFRLKDEFQKRAEKFEKKVDEIIAKKQEEILKQ